MRIILSLLLSLTMTPGVRYTDWRWRYIASVRRSWDGQRCVRCHSNGQVLHVHHKRPVARGGNYALWNLETLCLACHERRHGFDIDGDGIVSAATSRRVWDAFLHPGEWG